MYTLQFQKLKKMMQEKNTTTCRAYTQNDRVSVSDVFYY